MSFGFDIVAGDQPTRDAGKPVRRAADWDQMATTRVSALALVLLKMHLLRRRSPFASLPPEILQAILEQLVPPPCAYESALPLFSKPPHYRQLRQAALVARSWRLPAGRLLHLHVVIDSAERGKAWCGDGRRQFIATRGLVVMGIRLSEAEDVFVACRPGVELLGVSLSESATPQFLLYPCFRGVYVQLKARVLTMISPNSHSS